jgi:hypothetical protein
MVIDSNDLLEQLDRHLSSPSQAWLFGAGISSDAGVPLMLPLTARVRDKAIGTPHKVVLDALFDDLPIGAHIEHLLSHLGDYATLAERAKTVEVTVSGTKMKASDLTDAHKAVVEWIAETVRWGYRAANAGNPEAVGEFKAPIITIDRHQEFVEALFKTAQAGLDDRRGPIRLFSINYDTLLEDALALSAVSYWDGFSGGAVAFRNYHFGDDLPKGYRAHVIKLHGSIDWYLGNDGKVWRVRAGDTYPARTGRVLIYPQATKYVATQRDPFAAQFDLFRRTLSTTADNVLAVCGYSFGDEHINQEIESAMAALNNKTTMIVFYSEHTGWAECLSKWRTSEWGKRLYVATEKGLYVGRDESCHPPADGKEHDWWTFAGVTKLLNDGAKGCL